MKKSSQHRNRAAFEILELRHTANICRLCTPQLGSWNCRSFRALLSVYRIHFSDLSPTHEHVQHWADCTHATTEEIVMQVCWCASFSSRMTEFQSCSRWFVPPLPQFTVLEYEHYLIDRSTFVMTCDLFKLSAIRLMAETSASISWMLMTASLSSAQADYRSSASQW